MKKCKKCWWEVTGVEYIWAYDGVLEWKCKKCWYREHRATWLEILSSKQELDYWPIYFELEGWKKAKNNYIINNK